MNVTFRVGAPERFDLVIGAGGLHSPVRGLVFGPPEWYEKYLGYYVASFSAENYPWRDPHAYVIYSVPGMQLSRYSLRDDRTVFLFAFAADSIQSVAPHDLAAQKDILNRTFRRSGWECRDILLALEGCRELYFDPVSQIRMSAWQQGRVALVGDACFCPSLLAGQGSALAMAAAYILAGSSRRPTATIMRRFPPTSMLQPLMARKQRAAESFARSFVPRTELGIMVRNYVTPLMSFALVAKLSWGGC